MRRRGPGGPEGEGAADAAGEGWTAGRRAVLELLEQAARASDESSAVVVDKVLVADDGGTARWWRSGPAELARRAGAVVQRSPRGALDRLAAGAVHQGVMARRAARPLIDLEEVLEALSGPALLVLADGVEDPRNLGALIRTAAAAGADAVVLPERRSAGLGPAAAKAAAGALERIPLARTKNVQRALEACREHGVWTVGLDPAGPPLWDGPDLRLPTCLVIGGEGRGLSRLARERCDVLASLPLARGVESLNAAVAVSVALYEALRQRRGGLSGP